VVIVHLFRADYAKLRASAVLRHGYLAQSNTRSLLYSSARVNINRVVDIVHTGVAGAWPETDNKVFNNLFIIEFFKSLQSSGLCQKQGS
jgi:hypothetical protein